MATQNLNSQTKITVNNFPDSVRENPDVYIQGSSAALSCFREILDNSVDEHKAGFCDTITVAIDKNDNIMVQDNGRGIPIAPCDDPSHEGYSQCEVALTVLSAGGKFLKDSDNGYKQDTTGKNGMGSSIVNALSSMFICEVQANGHLYQMKFEKGVFTQRQKIVKDIDPSLHGTIIRYHLDPEMFDDISIDREKFIEMCQQKALLNNGLRINLLVQYEDGTTKKESFCYEDGMSVYLDMLLKGKQMAIDTKIHLSKTVPAKELPRDLSFDVSFGYIKGYTQEFVSFVNSIPTEDGGSHIQGLSQGICDAVRRYALEKKKIKNKTDFEIGDTTRGATGIIAIRYKKPSFDRQSKTKLDMPKVKTIVSHAIEDAFYDFLEKTPKEAEIILEKALQARKERLAVKKARENARNEKGSASMALPDKFADCTSNNPEECECFFVEGDSAAGSAKNGRNRKFQAILSVFGKICNAEREAPNRVLASPKNIDIGRALRTGFGANFNIEKLGYHKIILMSDADCFKHTKKQSSPQECGRL